MSIENGTLIIDGKKLRLLRERQKLTQLYLATSVEVTTETISRWENNRHPTIKRENAEKLAEVLGVDLQALLKDAPAIAAEPDALDVTAEALQDGTGTAGRRGLWAMLGAVLVLVVGGGVLWWASALSPAFVTVSRYLPAAVLPGQPFPVVIRIEGKDAAVPLMIREHLPPSCRLISALPGCLHVGQDGRQLKWVVGTEGGQVHTIVYLVQVEHLPLGQQLSLSGSLVSGRRRSEEVAVRGGLTTTISPFHWADDNQDHRLDDAELLAVFELLPQAEALGINLEEIKTIWAGSGYRWDGQQGRVVLLDQVAEAAIAPDIPASERPALFNRSKQP